MATLAVQPAMNGEKTLHPFFTKKPTRNEADAPGSGGINATEVDDDGADGGKDSTADNGKAKRKRKPKNLTQDDGKTQKTLQELVNPRSDALLTGDDEPGRANSKRRRVSYEYDEEVKNGPETPRKSTSHDSGKQRRPRLKSPQVIIPVSSPLPSLAQATNGAPETPPKKMLRINARGKFSSPVSRKPDEDEPVAAAEAKKRGRPRKPRPTAQESKEKLRVVIRYRSEIADKLDHILQGRERYNAPPKMMPTKQRTPRKPHPPKPTHPFFLGKSKDQHSPPKEESPRKASAVTPGKLKRQTLNFDRIQPPAEPTEVWTSTLLKDRLMMKHPGAKDPMWPGRDSTHVRGLDEREEIPQSNSKVVPLPPRKRKTAAKPFPESESIFRSISSNLSPAQDGELRPDGFREPHPSLRLPQKLLVPGEEILKLISVELSTNLRADSEDGLSKLPHLAPHPALRKLYNSIPHSLTAFDEGRGETQSWTQKYAPSTSADVLQPSREMAVLREWLTSLTVKAVENASGLESKSLTKAELKPRKKKRRRKNDDLDDFLVDSDEECYDMDELADPEDELGTFTGRRGLKSMVHIAVNGVKLSNAVLLSGPSGSGKTAAAYAVAGELGFKVFEISSCERRSGKDVLDKVGDMTENHLVKHQGTDAGETSSAEEPSRIEEAFQRDLASGRQGKMSAFFKPQATKSKAVSPKKKISSKAKTNAIQAIQNLAKKPAKHQQQSLILLEEIDVLFKDDKEFWTTVLKLIATSKRPFIMTCNDEDLVPLQAMTLHAILRFNPTQVDLAVDYLLLVAAAEGHLLRRESVASLYKSKEFDLRASLAELDLWCQMGIGDPRGGLSWIYQRYPPGSDLDRVGRKLRVVSDGTFQRGMDFGSNVDLDPDDQILWMWREHGIDPSTLLGWRDLRWLEGRPLKDCDAFADSLSATDVYSRQARRPEADTTQTPMNEKARSQYAECMALLQTDEVVDYTDISRKLAVVSTAAAFHSTGMLEDKNIHRLSANITTNPDVRDDKRLLTRKDFACFDAISVPVETPLSSGNAMASSAFDGPITPIAMDLAPYVRSIVQHDSALSEQRDALGGTKRARTTRAARSAAEGSQRAATRRERWFPKELEYEAVLATGGESWPRILLGVAGGGSCVETPASSVGSTGDTE